MPGVALNGSVATGGKVLHGSVSLKAKEMSGSTETEDKQMQGNASGDLVIGVDGYTPVRGVDYWTEEDKQEIVREVQESIEFEVSEDLGKRFVSFASEQELTEAQKKQARKNIGISGTDKTLTLGEDGVLRVNTADEVEQDNTLPVTSAAVHTTVGNIEVLLKLI